MDPDAIFLILLFLILLVLTIVNLIGLSKKILALRGPMVLKILIVGSLLVLLIIGLSKFDTVDTGKNYVSTAEIIVLFASFVIGLNWAINVSKRFRAQANRIKPYITIPVLTIAFSLIILLTLYWLANFFDKLNIMGSGG